MASKYRADLAQLTMASTEDVRIMLDSFRHDLDDNLPREILSVVKEFVGSTQGKHVVDTTGVSASLAMPPPRGAGTSITSGCASHLINSNLPQPYYQATAYGPTLPPGARSMLGGLVETCEG
jgi:hypothetical protein